MGAMALQNKGAFFLGHPVDKSDGLRMGWYDSSMVREG